jgi:hypothetical protein
MVYIDQPSVLEPMELKVGREGSGRLGDLGDVAEPVAKAVVVGLVGSSSDVTFGTAGGDICVSVGTAGGDVSVAVGTDGGGVVSLAGPGRFSKI